MHTVRTNLLEGALIYNLRGYYYKCNHSDILAQKQC